MKSIILCVLSPIKKEFVFFFTLFVLLIPRTIYYLITQPGQWFSLTHFPTLQFLSIAIFYSYILTLVVYITKSKIIKSFIYLIIYILFFVNLYLALNFKAAVSPTTMLLLLETTPSEIHDFISTYLLTFPSVVAFSVTLFLVVINRFAEKNKQNIADCFSKSPTIIRRLIPSIIFVFILGGVYSAEIIPQIFMCKNIEDMDRWNVGGQASMDHITGLLFSCYDVHLMSLTLATALENTIRLTPQDQTLLFPDDTCNIILVIGESFIKRHSNLYGYPLATNPRLQKEKADGRLFVFTDAISPYPLTSPTIKNMMSCNSIGDGEKWFDSPFFPAIFKNAGYNVYFWDNQYERLSNQTFNFSLNSYLHNAKISSVFDAEQGKISSLDGDLIDDFKSFRESHDMAMHNFVIFHLQGQHFDVKSRFPQNGEFNVFSSDDIQNSSVSLNKPQKESIANYDNCIYYNDSIIYSIISMYSNLNAVMVYLSDHGEFIHDFDGYKGTRADDVEKGLDKRAVRQYCEIPFIVWCSDKYKEKHGDIAKSLRCAIDKPLMSDNICHLLMKLGGVISNMYNESRDVLSDKYKCPPRIIYGKLNYDKL